MEFSGSGLRIQNKPGRTNEVRAKNALDYGPSIGTHKPQAVKAVKLLGKEFQMLKTPTLDAVQVRKALKVLKEVDPNSTKALRQELRSQLSPIAKQVAGAVPSAPPLSGFANNGATQWSTVTGKTSFTPGKSRKTGNSLVSIRVQPKAGRGIYIAELAGSRSSGFTAAGQNLIAVLNSRAPMTGRGGRFIYAKFRMLRPDVIRIAEGILDREFKKLEQLL